MQNNNMLPLSFEREVFSKSRKQRGVLKVCRKVFVSGMIALMLFSSSASTLVALSAGQTVSSHSDFSFTDIQNALPGTEYVSNTVTLHGLSADQMAEVTGGNKSSIIKNGIDTKKTKISMSKGDTIALKTISQTQVNTSTQVNLTVGEFSDIWDISTVSRETFTLETGESSGYTVGEFSVGSAGNATYNYPIFASPGTAGMTPGISLNYNHSSREDQLGVGWNIGGISVISRCNATLHKDGYNGGIDFDRDDRLCLDGDQLVAVSGEYGKNKTEYRTEHESFSKIISQGSAGDGPHRFTVWTKTGLKMEYAHTPDSRIEAPGKSDVLYWLVTKIEDSLGNYMKFSYEEDNGEYYIKKIDYTGNDSVGLMPYNSMEFLYRERENVTTKYLDGGSMQKKKILQSIRSYHADTLVRKYSLEYIVSQETRKNLLTKITECGINMCLKPLEFIWENPDNLQDYIVRESLVGIQGVKFGKRTSDEQIKIFPGDFNADGYSDIIELKSNGINRLALGKSGGEFEVQDNSNGLSGKIFYPDSETSGSSRILTGDFDGNGGLDVFTVNHSGNENWLWNYEAGIGASQSSGQGITKYKLLGKTFHSDIYKSRVITADFNGDSKTDVIHLSYTGNHWMGLSLGGGNFEVFDTVAGLEGQGFNEKKGKTQLQVLDMNNDTQADLLFLRSDGNHFGALSNGDGSFEFFDDIVGIQGKGFDSDDGKTQIFIGDYNADGNTDLLIMQANGDHFIALSLGDQTFTPTHIVPGLETKTFESQGNNAVRFHQVDANRDGKTDIMMLYADKPNVVYLSNGDAGFTARGNLGDLDQKYLGDDRSEYSFVSADWNGNGQVDFLYLKNDGNHWLAENTQEKSDVITQIKNGNTGTINIEYQELTNPDVYTKGEGAQYPYIDFTFPILVVASSAGDNGIGGSNVISYKYKGARNHQSGRGFSGFREFTMINENTGTEITNINHLDHRYAGLPEKTIQKLADGTVISETSNDIALKNMPGGGYFAYIYKSNSKSYELDGSLISDINITSVYDAFGNLTQSVTDYGSGYYEATQNVFENDTNSWYLGRLKHSTVKKIAPDTPDIERKVSFVYDVNTGLLIQEVTQPNDTQFRVVKNYIHDALGNIVQSSESGADFATKTLSSVYDSLGRFVIQVTNDLGHTTRTITEPLIGNVVSVTGPNGLVGTTYYDGMGRMIRGVGADLNESKTSYLVCGSACPTNAVHYSVSKQAGQAQVRTYYDSLDRIIRKESTGFDGQKVYLDTQYNEKGEVTKQSDPYFKDETPLWTRYSYDLLGRTVQIIDTDGRISTVAYAPHSTTRTNPAGQTSTKVTNVLGKMILSRDPQGNETTYKYDAFGKVIQITDSQGNESHIEYDLMGRRTKVIDPDSGTHTYDYNALGQIISQQDNSGNTTTFTYDVLGRVIKKKQAEGTTSWTYDTKENGIGKVSQVVGFSGDKQEYNYDKYGRNIETLKELDGTKYYTSYSFDENGRLDTMTYPSGLSVSYNYNNFGHLKNVRDASDDTLYWETDEVNARGQITKETFGNGLSTQRTFNTGNGYLTSLQTGDDTNSTSIQDLSFGYDVLGNVTNRQDVSRNLSEDFSYDVLNRLTSSHVTGLDAITLEYDELGNISSKSDVGDYVYGGGSAGVHAVSTISGAKQNSYSYDDRGNRISSNNEEIIYTSFNKPKQIQKIGETHTLDFSYAADGKRYKQVVTTASGSSVFVNTKYYVDGIYEREISGSTTKDVHYIVAGGENIAMVTRFNQGENSVDYMHYDHLGSLQALSDDDGNLKESYSYDAWGKRRDAETWGEISGESSTQTDRGFTMHEHLEEVGLIHMNGRVYDPLVGRFLSVDPLVQAPGYSQSLNRYSYVMNNPLGLVDPSGYGWLSKAWKSIKKAVKKVFKPVVNFVKKHWKTIAVVAVAIAMPFAVAALAGTTVGAMGVGMTMVSGFASGFAASFTGTILNGGSIGDALSAGLKSGAISGLTAGAFNQVGTAFGEGGSLASYGKVGKTIAHGVVGGVSNLAKGGKFLHGFMSAGFTQASDGYMRGFDTIGERMLASAVVGGTVAQIGGGKFANGAVTGAFSRLFNDEMHMEFSMRLPTKLGKILFGEDFIGQGGGIGIAVSYPGMWDKITNTQSEYDAGIYVTGHALGESIGTGRFSLGLGSGKGSVRGMTGQGATASVNYKMLGVSVGLDNDNNVASTTLQIGPGYNVSAVGTMTKSFTIRDGIDGIKRILK